MCYCPCLSFLSADFSFFIFQITFVTCEKGNSLNEAEAEKGHLTSNNDGNTRMALIGYDGVKLVSLAISPHPSYL